MSSITGHQFNCFEVGVWGYSDYPYMELSVIDDWIMLPIATIEIEVNGWFGIYTQFYNGSGAPLSVFIQTYNALHIPMEFIPIVVSGNCEEGSMADIDCTVEYQIQDDNGMVNPATLYAVIADTKTLAEIQTGLNALTPKLAAVVDGATTKINVTLHMAVVSGNANPTAESNNNETGNITFDVTGIKYPFTFNIPNFKDSLAVQGQIANSGATATLVTELITPTGTWCSFTDKYLNDLSAFNRGRTSFRGNRRQLARAASGRHNA